MIGRNSIAAHHHLLVASIAFLPGLISWDPGNSSRETSLTPVDSGTDTVNIAVHPGWNLLSLPITVDDGRVTSFFPFAVSKAYTYDRYYIERDTHSPGDAFWLKCAACETVTIAGQRLANDTIALRSGWNMIGTVGLPIPAASLVPVPSSILVRLQSIWDWIAVGESIGSPLNNKL